MKQSINFSTLNPTSIAKNLWGSMPMIKNSIKNGANDRKTIK